LAISAWWLILLFPQKVYGYTPGSKQDTNLTRVLLEGSIQLNHSNIILPFPFDGIEEEGMLILNLFIVS